MKQVSKASQLNKSVKQVSLASQVKQVGLASQVSNLPKSSQESEIKKVLVKQVQVKQVESSKFKLSNLNQASEVMLDRDTAPRKRPSPSLSGITLHFASKRSCHTFRSNLSRQIFLEGKIRMVKRSNRTILGRVKG